MPDGLSINNPTIGKCIPPSTGCIPSGFHGAEAPAQQHEGTVWDSILKEAELSGLISGVMSHCRFLLITLLGAALFSGCQPREGSAPSPNLPAATATSISKPGSASDQSTPNASPTATPQGEPSFSVITPKQTRTLSRTQLLSHPALEDLTITDKAAYSGQTLTFKAIPITALFEGLDVGKGMTIEFDSLDGFSASLDPALLLNADPKGAVAYLAIEEPEHPWPKLANGGSAGPLYLVWKNPEVSQVGQEQWPFQLRSFSIQTPIEERFPAILPEATLADDAAARQGFKVFLKNCFACHTLNGQGNGRLGPDLNEPHSPTEYLHEEYLRKLIRNPQDLRHWKGSRMSGFSEKALPDADLDLVIAYLKHKAEQRRASSKG